MSAAQLTLVSEWQRYPLHTQDPTRHAVPHPGGCAEVLWPSGRGYREEVVTVRVLGSVRLRWFGPVSSGCSRYAQRVVLCEVPGERDPQWVAVERFPEVS